MGRGEPRCAPFGKGAEAVEPALIASLRRSVRFFAAPRRVVETPGVGGDSTKTGSTSIGASIGGHRVARLIGSGGLGRVFECYTPTEQKVAIKMLRSKHAALGEAVLSNVRALRDAQSPHLVQVFDVAVFNNAPFIVWS
jgi:hypothetical protein